MPEYNDHPLSEVALRMESLLRRGWTVHQKFTCAACGSRQTIDETNRLFATGKCEECGHVTDIAARGCNLLAISPGKDHSS